MTDEQALRRRVETLETENERLRQQLENMRWMLEPPNPLPDAKLTPQQLLLYKVMERHPLAHHEQLRAAIRFARKSNAREHEESEDNLIKVQISKMRAAGLRIECLFGLGYRLIRAPERAAA